MNIFTGIAGVIAGIIAYVIITFIGIWITLFIISFFPKRLQIIYKKMTSEPKKNTKLRISAEQ